MSFLNDVDKIVKSAVKEIIGLPQDTPNAMLYTSNNLRGLQIMRATWEGFIPALQYLSNSTKIK